MHRSKYSADGANYGGTQPHDWGRIKSDTFPAGFFKTTDDYNIGLKKKIAKNVPDTVLDRAGRVNHDNTLYF